jgi:hypothetical protein
MYESHQSRFRVQLIALASVVALLLPVASFAAEPKWDQERLKSLADDLFKASDDLYTTLYKDQAAMGRLGGGDEAHEFKDTVRIVHSESGHLRGELKKGKGRDQTKPVIKRLLELNDDLQQYGRGFSMQNDALNRFAKLEDTLRQIVPYYGLTLDLKGSK